MTPPAMPTKLLVIGSGAIGIEFASFYNDMGAEVTVVEMLDPGGPGRGCRRLRASRKAAQEAGHDDPDCGRRRQARRHREWGQGRDQGQGRQGHHRRVQPCHRRHRHPAQYRGDRPGSARREDRSWPHRHPTAPARPMSRASGRSATSPRAALARAQGDARGGDRRRGDRRPASACNGRAQHPRLQPIAARRSPRSASPKPRPRKRATRSRSATSRGDRARRGGRLRQDRVRRQDRRIARRTHDRRRGEPS